MASSSTSQSSQPSTLPAVIPIRPHASSVSSNSSNSSSASTSSSGFEAKSILSCYQCGCLIRFKQYGAEAQTILDLDGFRARMGLERVIVPSISSCSSSASSSSVPVSPNASDSGLSSLGQPVINEISWEQQYFGDDHTWSRAHANQMGVEAFQSCNRRACGDRIEQILPSRANGRQIVWVSDWEVDRSFGSADEEGWIYAASFDDFGRMVVNNEEPQDDVCAGYEDKDKEQEMKRDVAVTEDASDAVVQDKQEQPKETQEEQDGTDNKPDSDTAETSSSSSSPLPSSTPSVVLRARRRRLVRQRQIDGSIGSWYHEFLDSSSLLLNKKSHSCHECELALIHSLQLFQTELMQEQVQHEECLKCLNEEDDSDDLATSLRELEQEEQRLCEEIARLDSEESTVQRQRDQLWQLGESMDRIVEEALSKGAHLQQMLGLSQNERQSIRGFENHALEMLRRLQRHNVFNDVFHIWHVGPFGTINGLRLGRLPTQPVEWVEINAALGQCALLLATVAERANVEFTRNKLVPRGSFSRVINMYGKEYYLFSDGGMFRRRGFNQAMILFLECVDDACKRAMRDEPNLKFPFKIQRGKIGDFSICLGNDEQWTKALKLMLTHLKWLLAWVTKRFPST